MVAGVSIHALLAESDSYDVFMDDGSEVSIHALLAESDGDRQGDPTACRPFQSTPSLRRATGGACGGFLRGFVSIHALLAESDKIKNQ